jgi:hypothetical protein
MHLLYNGCGGFIGYAEIRGKPILNTFLQIREHNDAK